MVVAAIAAAAVVVVGALVQYLNSEKARGASAAELAKLEGLLAKVSQPNYDMRTITPEEYAVVRRRVPEVANFISEKAPQLISADSADAVEGRSAQREALRRLISRGRGGPDLESRLLVQDALQQAGIANRGRVEAVKEDAARRGMGGSGNEFLAQLLGAQAGNEDAANSARAQAIENIRTKTRSMIDAATLGGQIRGEDVDLSSRNANIRNDFTARTAQRQQNQLNLGADTRNQADYQNLVNEQDVANRNIAGRNDSRLRERDYTNNLRSRDYENSLEKLRIRQGISSARRADIQSNARDVNSAVSGASEGAMTGLAYAYGRPPKQGQRQSDFLDDEDQNYYGAGAGRR